MYEFEKNMKEGVAALRYIKGKLVYVSNEVKIVKAISRMAPHAQDLTSFRAQ